MTERTIKLQGTTLNEIRKSAIAQLHEDMYVLSESVISDGQPVKVETTEETNEKALYKAQKSIPTNATIIEQKVLENFEIRTFIIDDADEQSAKSNAEKKLNTNEVIKNFRLIKKAKNGFLGIGKTRNQYEFEVLHKAKVQTTFQMNAEIDIKLRIIDNSDMNIEPVAIVIGTSRGFLDVLIKAAIWQKSISSGLARSISFNVIPKDDYRKIHGTIEERFEISNNENKRNEVIKKISILMMEKIAPEIGSIADTNFLSRLGYQLGQSDHDNHISFNLGSTFDEIQGKAYDLSKSRSITFANWKQYLETSISSFKSLDDENEIKLMWNSIKEGVKTDCYWHYKDDTLWIKAFEYVTDTFNSIKPSIDKSLETFARVLMINTTSILNKI